MTIHVERIREVNKRTARGKQELIRRGADYFVVSAATAPLTGPEVLIFPSTARGEITNWTEVGGGRGISVNQAIADFERDGPTHD